MLTILNGDMRKTLCLTQSLIWCARFKATAAPSALPKGWLNVGRKFPESEFTLWRSNFKIKTQPKFNRMFLYQLLLETITPMQKIIFNNILWCCIRTGEGCLVGRKSKRSTLFTQLRRYTEGKHEPIPDNEWMKCWKFFFSGNRRSVISR